MNGLCQDAWTLCGARSSEILPTATAIYGDRNRVYRSFGAQPTNQLRGRAFQTKSSQ